MKKYFFLSLTLLFATLLNAQVSMEEIGDFQYIHGKEPGKSIYQISYIGLKGEQRGTDGQYGGSVSPNYSYISQKTKKGNVKYWRLGFTGRCNRLTDFTMKKGGKISIKLRDNSVITLIADHVEITEDSRYGTWFSPTARLSTVNFNKITTIGVQKVRFETFPMVFDVEYNDDMIGDFLKKAAPILKDKINSKTDRMSKGF